MKKIPLAFPIIDDEMIEAAEHALRNERLVMGESVFKFEEEFARYTGTKEAVSTNSGTMALHLILLALRLRKKKVLTTPHSFIATSNAALHAGLKPAFADIDLGRYVIDPAEIKKKMDEDVGAILPVHIYGYPADMDEIIGIGEEYNVPVIEDACQAHGAVYGGKKCGSIGVAGAFSFYSIKNMTVGGDGGMVTTDDEELAELMRMIRDTGRRTKYEHAVIGYTARLNTVNAAIGRVQLRKLDSWNERRRELARIYRKMLSDVEEIVLPPEDDDKRRQVYHLFVIRTKDPVDRDRLISYLREKKIETGIHYPIPIHLQPCYREYGFHDGMYPNAELVSKSVISLPMCPLLEEDDVKRVCEEIKAFYGR
jgi:perosamine synthetase